MAPMTQQVPELGMIKKLAFYFAVLMVGISVYQRRHGDTSDRNKENILLAGGATAFLGGQIVKSSFHSILSMSMHTVGTQYLNQFMMKREQEKLRKQAEKYAADPAKQRDALRNLLTPEQQKEMDDLLSHMGLDQQDKFWQFLYKKLGVPQPGQADVFVEMGNTAGNGLTALKRLLHW